MASNRKPPRPPPQRVSGSPKRSNPMSMESNQNKAQSFQPQQDTDKENRIFIKVKKTPKQPQQAPSPFQQPQQQSPSPFQPQQPSPSPSPFQHQQQQQNPFQQQQQQQPQLFPSQFQQQQLQPQQQQLFANQFQQPQQQQQQLILFTNDKTPATYSTKWADLHPDSQKLLLQIEERILEYRDESQRLDQCSRLYDSSVSNDGFEIDAAHIAQELGGISTAIERHKPEPQELMAVVKDMLRNTEVAVRSFMMLQPRFLHPNKGGSSHPAAPNQQSATAMVPVFDFYSGLPKKPSLFFQQTIARFEKHLGKCRQKIVELEQLLLLDSDQKNNQSSLLKSIPKVLSNNHDFFVHVAAKVENIHQYIESMKSAYLTDQRRQGNGNDPFLEADRRETSKQEAAARRVHPTLHLPVNSQPSTQAAGLLPSSSNPGTTTASQTTFNSQPSAPSSSASASLFATPTTSAAAASSPQTSLFTASSSTSLFASATTPSMFGTSTPAFGTPTFAGSSLFSTPFASGAPTGSGASFGTISKSARPKARTARR